MTCYLASGSTGSWHQTREVGGPGNQVAWTAVSLNLQARPLRAAAVLELLRTRLTPTAGFPRQPWFRTSWLDAGVPPVSVYKQSTTLSGLISSSVSGIVGSRAERVKPQNF